MEKQYQIKEKKKKRIILCRLPNQFSLNLIILNMLLQYVIFHYTFCNWDTHFYRCFIVQEIEIATTQVRERAVTRNGASHIFVEHLVINYGQFQSCGISSDRQTEENYLHHR